MAVPATAQRAMANQMRGMSVPPVFGSAPPDHPQSLPAQRTRGKPRRRGSPRKRMR